jgi:Cof subfamily protein (haloacid dehalogenase superfamily)
MPVRLIAIDIDGTLVDAAGVVPLPNREAIHRAVTAGIDIVLVTGRNFHFARPVVEQLAAPITLVASNGALVKNAQGDTLLARALPRTIARALIAAADGYRGEAGLVFDREGPAQLVYECLDGGHARRQAYLARNRAFISAIYPLEDALTEDPLALVFNGSLARMHALVGVLRGAPAFPQVELTLTEYADDDFVLVDLMTRGCSKGATLAAWAGRRGIDRAEVMAVGDNFNDLEMLEFAGIPVVMGNAVAPLLARGWPVTARHDEAGLALAIERFALPAGPPRSIG